MAQGIGFSGLPVAPLTAQPQGLGGGGDQERQTQQIMQMLAQQASDPNKRRQMAVQLASQLPPPPDNIFGGAMKPPGRHQKIEQAEQPNYGQLAASLGGLMGPQQPGAGPLNPQMSPMPGGPQMSPVAQPAMVAQPSMAPGLPNNPIPQLPPGLMNPRGGIR